MRLPNDVRAAKCSERWMGLRSPVSCAKPTTSEDDTVFSSVSVMPTDKSSKNSVRSGGRFMRKRYRGWLLLLGRGAPARGRAARIVPVRHAFLDEGITRRALQFLVVRAEFAGCHFLLRIDRETGARRHQHDQSGRQKHVTRHALTPGCCIV